MDYKTERELFIFHKLLDLDFNIKSYGFDYWKMAIFYYNDFSSIVDLYKFIASKYGKTWTAIERTMRTAVNEKTVKKLKSYYNINDTCNIVVLRVICTEIYSVEEV